MYTVLIFIALIVCISLCGWAIAELKSNHMVYQHSAEETEAEQHAAEAVRKNPRTRHQRRHQNHQHERV